jgi:hypothetical protein
MLKEGSRYLAFVNTNNEKAFYYKLKTDFYENKSHFLEKDTAELKILL